MQPSIYWTSATYKLRPMETQPKSSEHCLLWYAFSENLQEIYTFRFQSSALLPCGPKSFVPANIQISVDAMVKFAIYKLCLIYQNISISYFTISNYNNRRITVTRMAVFWRETGAETTSGEPLLMPGAAVWPYWTNSCCIAEPSNMASVGFSPVS